jgi:NAD(P)-dependent dehydrogenase (short-subunit alcohol dehydrogenase family)
MAGEKKIAIVTGAASGIGRAMTLGLLGAGVDVAAVDRNEAGLAALAATVHDKPGAIQTIPADLAQPDAFDAIVAAVLSRSGKNDALVNNAGIGQSSVKPDRRRNPLRFWEITPEHWQRFLAVNATGPIMMARAVVPHMLAAGSGRVITVTTSLGTMVREGYLLYGASKAAAEAAMAVLAADLKGTGVTSNVLCRAAPPTPPSWATRREIARGCCSRRSWYRRSGGCGDGAAVRGDGLVCVAARGAGGREGGGADRVAVDRADAGRVAVSLLSERSGQGKAPYLRRALRRCRSVPGPAGYGRGDR